MKRSATFFSKIFVLGLLISISAYTIDMSNVCNEYIKLGDSLRRDNKFEKALTYYQNALQIDDKNISALFGLANSFLHLEQYVKAIEQYKTILTYMPNSVSSQTNLAYCLNKMGQKELAIKVLKKVLEHNPNHIATLKQLGQILKETSLYSDALACLQQAHKMAPHDTDILYLLGETFEKLDDFSSAVDCYKKILEIIPSHLFATIKIANLCNLLNRLEESVEYYKKALLARPNAIRIKSNYANTLKKLERVQEALELYNEVILYNPNYEKAHFGRALCYLSLGDFERGWPEYEWRWAAYNESSKKFNAPVWDGSDLQGKTILVYAEQGLGDTFQFIRYAKKLKELGAIVIFQSQNPAVDLLGQCDFIDLIIPRGKPIPHFDTHISLMSLPLIFKSNVETIPNEIPYLYVKSDLIKMWKEKLAQRESKKGQTGSFRIGICWQGNPNYRSQALRHTVAAKSIILEQFKPIANIPGVIIYSLQKMSGEEQVNNVKNMFELETFGPELDTDNGRFMDTAAIMNNLDLIITVDTSIAHVAGGLGVPTWLLLPNPSDWRWPIGWNYTPWYPEMKLFKQPQSGDWKSVIEEITNQLTSLIG